MKLQFIKWLAWKLKTRVIQGSCGAQLGPLLTRHYIVDTKPLGIYIHNLRRDDQRDLHDHPWPFVSLILNGGYIEIRDNPQNDNMYLAGRVLFRRAVHRHRLVVLPNTWTLVIKVWTCREWGFWIDKPKGLGFTHKEFVHWTAYDYERGCE
jgi:hypothetical protein